MVNATLINACERAPAEVWKTVPSKPELEASSWGRIRRKAHVGRMPHGGQRTYKSGPTYGVMRRASKKASHVYMGVYYRGVGNVKVHRAVCEAFHGAAPKGREIVLHLNENATDNRPENLRWGTQKENLNMPGFLKYCSRRRGDQHPRLKARAA